MTHGLARAITGGLLAASIASVAAQGQAPQTVDGIAAVVNNSVYARSFVRAARELQLVDPPARASDAAATMALIERHLILEEVARFAVPAPAAEAVAERRRVWAAALPPRFNLAAVLERNGLTEDDLTAWHREDLRIQSLLDKLFAASAQPTTREIADYVSRHQADLVSSGVAGTTDALDAAARRQLAQDNRQARIRDWIDGLKQRADIVLKIK